MLDRDQADAAAKAVMAPHLDGQKDRQLEAAERVRHQEANRRAARWGVAFALIGCVIGQLLSGRWFLGFIIGFGLGSVVGRWFVGRRA